MPLKKTCLSIIDEATGKWALATEKTCARCGLALPANAVLVDRPLFSDETAGMVLVIGKTSDGVMGRALIHEACSSGDGNRVTREEMSDDALRK